jgi:AGCS family alanine or glycine:cation symporter
MVWDISDALNALMVLPNLVAILLLSPIIASETRKYLNNIDAVDNDPIPLRTDL